MLEARLRCGTVVGGYGGGNSGVGDSVMASVCDPQGSLRTRSVGWVRSLDPSFAVCNCSLSHNTRLYLPLSLAVRNVNTLRVSTGLSLSITSGNVAQQSQGTGLKGHSERVSGCPSGREHRLKVEFHEFVSSRSEVGRWPGDNQKSENLPPHKRSHTGSSSYFSLGW